MKKIENERTVNFLGDIVHMAVRVLSVLMVIVILWAVIDVGLLLFQEIVTEPYGLMNIDGILSIFSAFLVVLIAIEIFQNITIYLKEEFIHVRIVIATALMAISRKIIVLDFKEVNATYIAASALVILALGVTYWLIAIRAEQQKAIQE